MDVKQFLFSSCISLRICKLPCSKPIAVLFESASFFRSSSKKNHSIHQSKEGKKQSNSSDSAII